MSFFFAYAVTSVDFCTGVVFQRSFSPRTERPRSPISNSSVNIQVVMEKSLAEGERERESSSESIVLSFNALALDGAPIVHKRGFFLLKSGPLRCIRMFYIPGCTCFFVRFTNATTSKRRNDR